MTDVRIPKMGMSTVEVDLVAWHVKVGDRVQEGDSLADVESEKATITVTAPVSGTVAEILVNEGQTTSVGEVICRIRPD